MVGPTTPRGTSKERFKAREELAKIGRAAVPALVEATKSTHFFVCQSAIQTLGDIKDPSAVPALLSVLEGDNIDLAAYACQSLSKITLQYFDTIGIGDTPEERKAVIANWKKWWDENSEKGDGE